MQENLDAIFPTFVIQYTTLWNLKVQIVANVEENTNKNSLILHPVTLRQLAYLFITFLNISLILVPSKHALDAEHWRTNAVLAARLTWH